MSRERELLEQALEYLPTLSVTYKEISDFLSTPEPTQDQEPVAFKLHPKYEDEDGYFDFTDNVETANQLHDRGWTIKPLYLHPAPRKPFVRLSEEEINALTVAYLNKRIGHGYAKDFARAVEDALEEKNK